MSEQRAISIVDRLRFDATRCELQFSKGVAANITEAADEIAGLRAQLASAMVTLEDVPGETMNDRIMRIVEWNHSLAEALLVSQDRLASARKALELARSAFHEQGIADRVPITLRRVEAALTDEQREHDPNMNPVDDAEFGMKP